MTIRDREEDERVGARGPSDLNPIMVGRFIHPGILPPTREARLQSRFGAEPGKDMPYHFGKKAYPVSAISALTLGTCWIQSIQFYVTGNSTPVTAIPEGSQFQMGFHWHATNNVGSLTDAWSVCIVYWEGADPQTSAMTGYFFDDTADDAGAIPHPTYLENTSLTNSFAMPARAVTFHFNMFLNDDHAPAQGYPTKDVWASLKA